jgi:AcrR family transcriptional regulator
MGDMTSTARDEVPDALAVRPPRQERSRQAWARVLDAGVAILEEGGYEAFTIAAVCERAQVPPRALYDRTSSKDALFLAVYEHGLDRIRVDEEVFTREEFWAGLEARRLIETAVAQIAASFARHAAFLRSVVLLSGGHPEVYRRGSANSSHLSDLFAGVVLRAQDQITHPDPGQAVRLCFSTIFAACVLRVAYGPGFAGVHIDEETFVEHLTDTAARYLLGPEHSPGG